MHGTRIPTAYGDESGVIGKEPYIHDMRTVTLHNFGLGLKTSKQTNKLNIKLVSRAADHSDLQIGSRAKSTDSFGHRLVSKIGGNQSVT